MVWMNFSVSDLKVKYMGKIKIRKIELPFNLIGD